MKFNMQTGFRRNEKVARIREYFNPVCIACL